MPKKYFLIVDTETTQTQKVADLGLVVADKQGNIHGEWGIIIADFYCNRQEHPLFHIFGDTNDTFSKASLPRRYARYDAMIKDGTRFLGTVNAVNNLLGKIQEKYNPVLTAYNLAFDADKLANSGIDANAFHSRFCLWHAAVAKWGQSKTYRQFVLDQHLLGTRTAHGNMTYTTKADYMAKFVLGNPALAAEPHTALEDARDYELPILAALVKSTPPREYMNAPGYNWRNHQVKDWFQPR